MTEASRAGDDSDASQLPAPLGFTGVARHSWSLYRANFGQLIRFFLFVNALLLLVALARTVASSYFDIAIQLQTFLFMIHISIVTVAGTIATGISSAFIVDRVADRDVSLRAVQDSLRPAYRDLMTTGVLAGVLSLALVMVLGNLGWFLVPIVFGPPIVVQVLTVERMALQEGWPRARELGAREWGRVFMYLITIALACALLVNLVLYAIAVGINGLDLAKGAVRTTVGVAYGLLVPHLLYAFTWPLIATTQAVTYLDVRARKEELTNARLRVERDKVGPPTEEEDPTLD